MVIRENKSQLRNRFRQERKERFVEDSWNHILTATEMILATNIATYIFFYCSNKSFILQIKKYFYQDYYQIMIWNGLIGMAHKNL